MMGMIISLSFPVYFTLYAKQNVKVTMQDVVGVIDEAQRRSMFRYDNAAWGAYADVGSVTLYKGATYAARVQASDEIFSYQQGVTLGSAQDIPFSLGQGRLASTKTLIFSQQNETKTLSVSRLGILSY